ncbi:MAG: right-handed parallel beta-helix repeat-containing protein [Verrucomicrobia bacterium]|nr:right-handed parallel beta-helix repeat-containing protein [Verrucomicrobiota bacterium]MCH8526996.1 right-handed parallel beta-helix repeat-containing protein [Kiritimatiellia bacterium]
MKKNRREMFRRGLALIFSFGACNAPAWTNPSGIDVARAPFITAADEEVHELVIRHGDMESVQRRIEEARASHPDAVLVIRLDGRFVVGQTSLQLGSRMNLLLEPGAELVADSEWAGNVIEIRDAELSGVYGPGPGHPLAVIDGNMRSPVVIRVVNSAKIHFSYLDIRNALGEGIRFQGRGGDRFGEASSIVHCLIRDHSGSGAQISDAEQFVFIHNELRSNSGHGVEITSHTSVVADNLFRGHEGFGVVSHSENGTVARNTIHGGKGIRLSGRSRLNLVTYNRLLRNEGVAIAVDGRQNSVYYNELDRPDQPFTIGGCDNIIASHRNVSGGDVVAIL